MSCQLYHYWSESLYSQLLPLYVSFSVPNLYRNMCTLLTKQHCCIFHLLPRLRSKSLHGLIYLHKYFMS